MVITFMAGVAFGVALEVARRSLWPRWKPQKRTEKAQKYGHPWAPVPALKAKLPKPPLGYAWETLVQHDDKGTPFLHLNLLDLTTGEPAAQTKRNLVMGNYRTYADEYRSYSLIKDRTFNNDLLGPVLDWATAQVDRFGNANASGEYSVQS